MGMRRKKNVKPYTEPKQLTKRNKNATPHIKKNASQTIIMVRNVQRSQKKNAPTRMYQNTTRFPKRNVTRRPFLSATMFHKNTATPIPYQNATRFPNSTAQRNTRKSVPRFQLKFQSRSKKAFVYGLIRDTAMMMIIVKKF